LTAAGIVANFVLDRPRPANTSVSPEERLVIWTLLGMGPHARASPDPPPVIAREDAESFKLRPTEEEELLRASAEAERGNLVDGGEVLATLRRT